MVNLDIVEQGVWLATGPGLARVPGFIVEYDGADRTTEARHKDANTRADLRRRLDRCAVDRRSTSVTCDAPSP